MKKKTSSGLLAALALALSAPARAEVGIGVLGGSSFASLSQHPAEAGLGFDRHPFFGAGAVADVRLGRRLSLRLEPMFLVKGSGFSIEPDLFLFQSRVTARFRLSYLELPLLLRFSSGSGRIRPYVMAGPSYGRLVRARVQGTDTKGKAVDEDVMKEFKRSDLGLGFGAGLVIPAGRSSTFVQGRYTLGLLNIAREQEGGGEQEAGTRLENRTIQVMVGVTFPLGRH
jgi:hypothetical protein